VDPAITSEIIAGTAVVVGAAITVGVPVLFRGIGRRMNSAADRIAAQNSAEHQINKEILSSVVATVERIDQRLDEHVSWHLHQQPNVVKIIRPDRSTETHKAS
jgi:hypothetical protein